VASIPGTDEKTTSAQIRAIPNLCEENAPFYFGIFLKSKSIDITNMRLARPGDRTMDRASLKFQAAQDEARLGEEAEQRRSSCLLTATWSKEYKREAFS
jgi:hypothetical protein